MHPVPFCCEVIHGVGNGSLKPVRPYACAASATQLYRRRTIHVGGAANETPFLMSLHVA